jgi:predicted AlkP superfamily pyrophosphatase or phosphodiesterase
MRALKALTALTAIIAWRRRPRPGWRRPWLGLAAVLALLAALAGAGGAGGARAKPLNPNAPKKPPPQGTAKPQGGPAVPRLTRRVVMVSLDGAGAEELQQLWRDDLLDEGGFARFFREGEVASALVPVDPTLTAPNHVSLATGAAPDHTGIVGNHFPAAGSPPFAEVGGFSSPIGAETLWEAARRQKKRAAVLTWPGADGNGPRRQADIGMTYVTVAERAPRLLVLGRSDWQPAAAPPKLASRLPVVTVHVNLGGAEGAAGAIGSTGVSGATGATGATGAKGAGAAAPAAAGFDLYAVARGGGDNQEGEGYDGVVVATSAPAGGKAPSVANLEQSAPLAAGQWAEIAFPDRGGRAVTWVKVLALDPDLETVRVYFTGTYPMPAYPADFAKDLAESNLAWPGPPDDRRLAAARNGQPGIDLDTWVEQAERFAAFFGGAMRVAAARDDWDLMLGYMPVIDLAGHALLLADPHQAGYSVARRDELARARRRVWQAVDHELRLLMAAVDLGRTTVVVVSDHGMAPAHTAVDLNALLRDRGLLAAPAGGREGSGGGGRAGVGGVAAYVVGNGGMAHLYLEGPEGGAMAGAMAGAAPAGAALAGGAAARQRQLLELRDQLLAFRSGDDTPIERAVTRQEAAELGLDHPNSGDLILFAHEGYTFDPGPAPAGAATTHPAGAYGMHGYLASHPDMRGIYMAIGKDVKPGTTSGTVQAIDVAGRVAAWLGIGRPSARAAAAGGAGAPGSGGH